MKNKLIFEIPVYAMCESKFQDGWDKYKNQRKEDFLECNPELGDYEQFLNKLCFPMTVWKYNQIIGYIQVLIRDKDIVFDLWLSKKKRFFSKSQKKSFIEYMPTVGLHFYTDNKNNCELKSEIDRYLIMIEKEFLRKNFYLDKTIYNNLINDINLRRMIDEI